MTKENRKVSSKKNPYNDDYFEITEDMSLDEIANNWVHGKKGYSPGNFIDYGSQLENGIWFHGWWPLEELWPYREYDRPFDKNLLKSILQNGFMSPIHVDIFRDGCILVVEGNHRLKAAMNSKGQITELPVHFHFMSQRLKENPRLLKDANYESYAFADDIIKENLLVARLPDESSIGPIYEPNTYQIWLFDLPENVSKDNVSLFFPRGFMKGRILRSGFRHPFQNFFRQNDKSVIASVQFIIQPDSVEVIYMSTRPGWKRLGLMSLLIDYIEEKYKKPIVYFEPTKVGEKFIRSRK